MKTIGNALFDLLSEMEILEPETLEIASKVKEIPNADLLQIDSIIKLSKYSAQVNENLIDVETAVQNIGR